MRLRAGKTRKALPVRSAIPRGGMFHGAALRRLALLGTGTCLALSGCGPVPHSLVPTRSGVEVSAPEWAAGVADSGDPEFGPPLPAGAVVEAAGAKPAAEVDTRQVEGSLRPDSATPAQRVPEVIARGHVIVGVDQSLNLISYRDAVSGQLRGWEVDLAREIARDIFGDPDKVEFRFVQSASQLSAVRDGDVDMVIRTMTITRQRQQEVAFSTPYLTTDTRMLVARGSGLERPADLAGRTACVAEQSTGLQTLRRQSPGARIIKTRSWADCLVALQQHHAEAIIADDPMLSGIAAQDQFTQIVGPSLSVESYGVAMTRPEDGGNPGLIRQVNATLERIRADGTWWRLFKQWFSGYLSTPGPPPAHYRAEGDAAAEDAAADTASRHDGPQEAPHER